MPIVPLFGGGFKGKSPNVTAQQRINLYGEIQPDGDKTRIAFYGRAGRSLFTTFGDTPARGAIAVGVRGFVVHRGTLWEINNAGTQTSRGTLSTTTGRVDLTTDGVVILITDGTAGYTFTLATNVFAVVAAADYPDAATTCTWLDGQFIVDQGSGDSFQISSDGTTWDALDVASAESAPDGLVRVFADHGEISLFGEATTEFWGNTGAQDFPFAPVRGSTIEYGLAARWSLAKFNDSLAGLFKNKMGQVQVMMLKGYTPTPLSNPELDSIINSFTTVSDATGFSRMQGGHPFYQINFPTGMKSFEFDALSGLWGEVQYGLNGERDRGEMCLDYVNKPRLFDYSNGNVYMIDPTLYSDNGDAIRSVIVTRHFFQNYDRVTINRLFVDFESGVGLVSGQGVDPQVMLRISRDGGHSYGNELRASMGKIGKYPKRAEFRRLGTARDYIFELAITDPVKRVIVGAGLDYTPGYS
jgi:hypothetical protein